MNQPTEDRIKRLEEEQKQLKEEVRQLREQITEPIRITRLEIDQGSIQSRLDNHVEMMKEQDEMLTKIYTDVGHMKVDIGQLKGSVSQLTTDIEQVKTIQNGHSKFFEEHGRRLSKIEATMATKDDISRLEARIDGQGQKLDEQGQKLDGQGQKLDEQGQKLDLILQLLSRKGE